MKFYIHLEDLSTPHTIKIAWESASSASDSVHLCEHFLRRFNKKFPSSPLGKLPLSSFHLVNDQQKVLPLAESLWGKIQDGEDIYLRITTPSTEDTKGKVKYSMAAASPEKNKEEKVLCTHSGCGERYFESENHEKACLHHPGPAIFHDGMKGWQCCTKRVVSFTDFLDIVGCTRSYHTTEKVEQPDIAVTCPRPGAADQVAEAGSSSGVAAPNVAMKEEEGDPLEIPDAEDAIIADGQECLHRGCDRRFKGEKSRKEQCVYHPGMPLFHEGLKGWTCCKKRVHEFDMFLQIMGCKSGLHKFVPPPKPKVETVHCRHDFYQSPTHVTMNVYAKKVDKSKSSVTITAESITVSLAFLDKDAIFQGKYELYMPINADDSRYEILSTKVELVLSKASPVEWPALERSVL